MLTMTQRLLIEALMTPAAKRRIATKKKQGLCIRQGCTRKAASGRRGNCQQCFDYFSYAKSKLPTAKERREFDAKEVAAGNVFESRRGRRPAADNPYAVRA